MRALRTACRISSARLEVVAAAASVLLLATSADGQETTRVSVDSSGAEGNSDSWYPSISADGWVVAFHGDASNLVAGDTNGWYDVFVHDRKTGVTERVSVDSSGAEGNSFSGFQSISADGQVVAYSSYASNLVAGDTNGTWDVFVRDRAMGITERVSVDSSGVEGNGGSGDDRPPSISADGRFVAFGSYASNLVAGDTNVSDIFVHDRVTGITERVSVDSSGAQANGGSDHPSISADGQVVTFDSWASNLVFGDTNGWSDIFVHDRVTGITERMSVDSSGAEANSESWPPSISADGQVVAFGSNASNLVAGDTNGWFDVFVHERATGITERVSVDSSGAEGNRDSRWPSISVDGQVVAFHSDASNLVAGDSNSTTDVFVHDRATAITERVSVDSTGTEANSISGGSSISADGQVVAFYSSASNLVAGDTNGAYDVFVHEYCLTTASWTNYGSGFPGTNGIPSLTSQQNPSFGATITVTLDNSYGAPTFGFLVVGLQRGSFHMKSGAQLLVVPTMIETIHFSNGADSFTGTIPVDESLCGVAVDVQGIEADPGAAGGLSFSPGLELVIGS
jgi:Tol biopolymer transport system component